MNGYTKQFVGIMDKVTGEEITEVDQTYLYTTFIGQLENEMVIEQIVPALHMKGDVFVHAINYDDGWTMAYATEGIGEDVVEFFVERPIVAAPEPESYPTQLRGSTVHKRQRSGEIIYVTSVAQVTNIRKLRDPGAELAAEERSMFSGSLAPIFAGRFKYSGNVYTVFAQADAAGSLNSSVWYMV